MQSAKNSQFRLVSKVFITAIIMMNVVLAILLDKYLQSAKDLQTFIKCLHGDDTDGKIAKRCPKRS